MRKTLGITLIAGTLMFGGAGVANATAPSAPVPSIAPFIVSVVLGRHQTCRRRC